MINRYQINYGKYGAYFYDNDLKCDMTLDEVLIQINKTKICDICGESNDQVYCKKCLENSVHNQYRLIAKKLKEEEK